jgi:hypothetical protein
MTEPAEIDEFLRVSGFETLDDCVEALLEAQRDLIENPPFYYEDKAKRRRDLRRALERDRGRKLMSLNYAA